MWMSFILLFSISAMVFTSFFPGSKANKEVMIEGDRNQQLSEIVYENLLEELNGAHLRIAATHVIDILYRFEYA